MSKSSPGRSPRKWWYACTSSVEARGVRDANKVCGALWSRTMTPESRKAAARKYEVPVEKVEKSLGKVVCPACLGHSARKGIACKLCSSVGEVVSGLARDYEKQFARIHAGHHHSRDLSGVDFALPERALVPIVDKASAAKAPRALDDLRERGVITSREHAEGKNNVKWVRALWGLDPWPVRPSRAARVSASEDCGCSTSGARKSSPPPLPARALKGPPSGPGFYVAAGTAQGPRILAGPYPSYAAAQDESRMRPSTFVYLRRTR